MQETQKPNKNIDRLENQSSTLGLLVTTTTQMRISRSHNKTISGGNVPQLEVLAALQSQLLLGLAGSALETQDNLLGGLGLLVENGLGLTTVTTLLPVVTALTLGVQGGLYSMRGINQHFRSYSGKSC